MKSYNYRITIDNNIIKNGKIKAINKNDCLKKILIHEKIELNDPSEINIKIKFYNYV